MCFNFFKQKPIEPVEIIVPVEPEEKPDWVTQSREETALEEEAAASIHLTYMELIAAGEYPDDTAAGNYEHHKYWYTKHQEAAWYIRNP